MLNAVEWGSELVLVAVVVVLAIPAIVLLLQVAAPCRLLVDINDGSPRPAVCVVVPAHNEEACIGETLRSIRAQLRDRDRVMVVADNCEDATARLAREADATVIERYDGQNRGKGFAIEYAKPHVQQTSEFEVIIVIDADCRLGEGAIELLSKRCMRTDRPVQAAYLIGLPERHQYRFGTLKLLAGRVKNYVRPLGGGALGFPCQLLGSGMAFPGRLFAETNFATSSIVEDLKYGIELAIAGHPPVFCPQAHIYSSFPVHAKAMLAQRKRWEHGHLSSMAQYFPVLARQALRQRRLSLLAMAADLTVPPLALFLLSSLVSGFGALGFFLATGRALPMIANLFLLTTLLAALATIWIRHGRNLVSPKELRQLPFYVLSKLPLYVSFIADRQTHWIRTDRDTCGRDREVIGGAAGGDAAENRYVAQ
jgi:cellulose synthase/poly-beta-1,6-N-acetylglucosamine synthase-like glycosyltransferase